MPRKITIIGPEGGIGRVEDFCNGRTAAADQTMISEPSENTVKKKPVRLIPFPFSGGIMQKLIMATVFTIAFFVFAPDFIACQDPMMNPRRITGAFFPKEGSGCP